MIDKRVMAVIAAAGLAGPALAQQLDPMREYPVRRISATAINGIPMRAAPQRDALEIVYSNIDGPYFSSTAEPRMALDAGSFTPGPGAGGPVAAEFMTINVVVPTTFTPGVDIETVLWNTVDPVALFPDPINTDEIERFVVTIDNGGLGLDPGFIYLIDIDLLTAFPTGIVMPDDDWAIDFRYYEIGTTTPNLATTVGFSQNEFTGGPFVGSSEDWYARDNDGDGIYTAGELFFFGGPPFLANFALEILAETDVVGGCYADCDQSQSLDFFDFLCFQNAFASGDPYADCDDSMTLDFFDFLCFQDEFARGCP